MSNSETCLVIFNDGDHFVFSGRERSARRRSSRMTPPFKKLICAGTTAFWDAYLKGNAEARTGCSTAAMRNCSASRRLLNTRLPNRRRSKGCNTTQQ